MLSRRRGPSRRGGPSRGGNFSRQQSGQRGGPSRRRGGPLWQRSGPSRRRTRGIVEVVANGRRRRPHPRGPRLPRRSGIAASAAAAAVGLTITGEADGNLFGFSVSLSDDAKTLAVGAPYTNVKGRVSIYRMEDSELVWKQIGEDIEGEAADDRSGYSVSLLANGTMVAIGSLGAVISLVG